MTQKKYGDDFKVGELFETAAITLTEAHIVTWAGLTGDFYPLHMDREYAAKTQFGERLVHGPLIFGLAVGLVSLAGIGGLTAGTPPAVAGKEWPSCGAASTMTPGGGFVAHPGFVGTAPGTGEIMMPPVSVCHQVSTMGQRLSPMIDRYHIHASGLIGSPTDPSSRNDDKSYCAGKSAPSFINERIAVGAV